MYQEKFDRLKKQSLQFRFDNPQARIGRLNKIKKWILSNEKIITEALQKDFSKPAFETEISEVIPVIGEINLAVSNLKKWMKDKSVTTPLTFLGHSSYVRYENKGLILIISPWNYPFQLAISPLIAALAAGNTAIIKPSELTPNTAELIRGMIDECFPPNEVLVICGGKEVALDLLSLPFDHVFFTGSTRVGKIVAQKCAELLTPYTLELGGKSPVIVDENADLDDVVQKIHWGKFLNRGQTCVAPDYLVVHKNIKSKLIKKIEDYTQKSFNYEKASIINFEHLNRINKLTDKVDIQSKETIIRVIDSPDLNSPIMKEEIFGPILPIITFDTFDSLLITLRKNEHPLAMYVFSKNKDFQNYLIKSFSSGGVGINCVLVQFGNHYLPFGGIKSSGQGRYHGHSGFLEFSHHRAIIKQNYFKKITSFFYPPYTDKKLKLILFFKKYLI